MPSIIDTLKTKCAFYTDLYILISYDYKGLLCSKELGIFLSPLHHFLSFQVRFIVKVPFIQICMSSSLRYIFLFLVLLMSAFRFKACNVRKAKSPPEKSMLERSKMQVVEDLPSSSIENYSQIFPESENFHLMFTKAAWDPSNCSFISLFHIKPSLS
jgi:hypothetical protein